MGHMGRAVVFLGTGLVTWRTVGDDGRAWIQGRLVSRVCCSILYCL